MAPKDSASSSSPSSSSSSSSSTCRSCLVLTLVGTITFIIGIMVGVVFTPSYLGGNNNNNSPSTSSKDNSNIIASSPRKRDPNHPRIAFVGYMDRVHNAVYEIKWMYFSALGSGVKGDILLMGHPEVKIVPSFCTLVMSQNTTVESAREALDSQKCNDQGWPAPNGSASETPCNVRCLVIANEKDDAEAVNLQYPFLRSLHFPNDPTLSALLLQDYDYVLKTDLDVFLTPKFLTLRPPRGQIYGGKGAYVFYEDVSARLVRISKDMNLKHRRLHNVGATWYGDAKTILTLTSLARTATIHILRNEFKNGPGKWAGWYRGVSSMYGGEVAVNHLAPNYLKGELDMACSNKERTCKGSLIHAWHQVEVFSKFELHKYDAAKTFEDAHGKGGQLVNKQHFNRWMSTSGNYALYVAMNVKAGILVPPHGVWGRDIC